MRKLFQRALFPLALLAVFGSYSAVAGCSLIDSLFKPRQKGTQFTAPIQTPSAVGEVWSLPQGWTVPTMRDFWQGTQGAEIVPYDYFLHLEQADSQELFRSNANMESLRYLPQRPDPVVNPDGLPVGFAKTTDNETNVDWMGFTCAACHTAQLAYGDREIRIEGGPTLADYRGFQTALNAALRATAADTVKFGRFAAAVLGPGASREETDALRDDLGVVLANLERRARYNESDVIDGYGRVDALGQIFNAVTAYDLRIDDNARSPDAPVSYPFLWGTPESNVVQWNGSVSNDDGGVGRNVGQLTGVFGHVDIVPQTGIANLDGYESSIQQKSLGRIEVWVEELWAPIWPEEYLPAIDRDLAARGQTLYAARCENCHYTEVGGEPYDPRDDDRRYAAKMVGVDTVGTDPKLVDNFSGWLKDDAVQTGDLEGAFPSFIGGTPFGATASGLEVLTHVVGGVLLNHKVDTIFQILEDHEGGLIPGYVDSTYRSYKGRPLFGVWATAPFLHNGSVPTLHDLLLPPEARPDSFWVGNRDFDPVKVGYVTTEGEHGFWYNTSVDGNRNMGHAVVPGRPETAGYGTDLSEADRMALIEYIKSLGLPDA